MNSKEKKKRIFNLFSQNLEWVKEHKDINFVPDFSNGYICPICFDVFFEEDLDSSLPNSLTLEDVPPASLGGKPLILTCKSCNSKNGHELDAHLLNILLDNDSRSFLPNSNTRASFEVDGNKVNGRFSINKEGEAYLSIDPKVSNPKYYKSFLEKIKPPPITIYNPLFYPDNIIDEQWRTPKFNMSFQRVYNERRAEVALLRIAYLIAFANFGHGFLINGGLYKVREQILSPDKEILPNVFWIKHEFPKEMEGLNIISFPKEMQSFLIIFNLITKSKTTQVAIALPGPSKPSIDIYNYLEKKLCMGDGTEFHKFNMEHLASRNYLKTKEYAFASNLLWQQYTNNKPKNHNI